tara:strand:+ start:25 stop:258 length:234 start_codon:yes stop_codon:yes gene_type:complete
MDKRQLKLYRLKVGKRYEEIIKLFLKIDGKKLNEWNKEYNKKQHKNLKECRLKCPLQQTSLKLVIFAELFFCIFLWL